MCGREIGRTADSRAWWPYGGEGAPVRARKHVAATPRERSRPANADCARALQAFFVPQSVDSLLVHLMALDVALRRPGTPEPMAGVFGGVGAQPGPHLGVGVGWCLCRGQAAVSGAGQPNGLARQPFRHAQCALEHVHGAPLGSWAQNFPFATSRSASFSSSASASSLFKRVFCSRSSRSSLAASVSMPP